MTYLQFIIKSNGKDFIQLLSDSNQEVSKKLKKDSNESFLPIKGRVMTKQIFKERFFLLFSSKTFKHAVFSRK
jgi:hypothetical protein